MRILILFILAYLSLSQVPDSLQVNIFKNLHTTTNKNLLISPYSIHLVLSLAANGAAGATQSQMLNVISPSNPSLDYVNRFSYNLLIKNTGNAKVSLANGIFSKIKPSPQFTDIATKYQATAQKLISAGQINKWVALKTGGKITQIVNTISPDTKLLLVSALYFSSRWKTDFEDDKTRAFYTRSFGVVPKKFIQNTFDSVPYFEDASVRSIKLELQDNYSFHIMMPKDLDSFVNGLTQGKLDILLKPFAERGVVLRMPEFTFNYSICLKQVLSSLGMKLPFTNDADFSNLTSAGSLLINCVNHKTFIKVNKQGIEATAATLVEFEITSGVPAEQYLEFVIDRPFVFAIKDINRDTLLFLGKVENP
jgi:serine protease inhibitor